MKRIFFILVLIILPFLFGLKEPNSAKVPKTVSCYYSKTVKEPLLIYDAINGNVIDSLYNTDIKYSWYNLLVSKSKGRWLKIDSLYNGPAPIDKISFKNCWVKSDSIKVGLWEGQNKGELFFEPKFNSKYVEFEIEFAFGYIQQVKNGWTKVAVPVSNSEMYEGWVPRNQQCGSPWTTCCNDF